jgi:hypothetical protein
VCGILPETFFNTDNDEFIGVRFDLHGANAVLILVPTKKTIDAPGGYRDMFRKIWTEAQSGAIPLQRGRLKKNSKAARVRTRTSWFGAHYGAHYDTGFELQDSLNEHLAQVGRDITRKMVAVVEAVTGKAVVSMNCLRWACIPSKR